MNNKGFAVTTVLYTLLIAFLMFLGAALAMFASSSSLIGKANDDLINGTVFSAMQVTSAATIGTNSRTTCVPEQDDFKKIADYRMVTKGDGSYKNIEETYRTADIKSLDVRKTPSNTKYYWFQSGGKFDSSGNLIDDKNGEFVIIKIKTSYGSTLYWPKDFNRINSDGSHTKAGMGVAINGEPGIYVGWGYITNILAEYGSISTDGRIKVDVERPEVSATNNEWNKGVRLKIKIQDLKTNAFASYSNTLLCSGGSTCMGIYDVCE